MNQKERKARLVFYSQREFAMLQNVHQLCLAHRKHHTARKT